MNQLVKVIEVTGQAYPCPGHNTVNGTGMAIYADKQKQNSNSSARRFQGNVCSTQHECASMPHLSMISELQTTVKSSCRHEADRHRA